MFSSIIAKMPGAAALVHAPSLRKPIIDYYLRCHGTIREFSKLSGDAHADRELTVDALLEATLSKPRIRAVLDYAPVDFRRPRSAQDISIGVSAAEVVSCVRKYEPVGRGSWSETEMMNWLFPYGGSRTDPALAARYHALARLPPGTLGRAFWEKYQQSGYAFPGEPTGMNEAFTNPHDCTHVLSGYDTTPKGEVLASIFVLSMHPLLPMEAHILSNMFDWHLGRKISEVSASVVASLDPAAIWHAWARGEAARDLFCAEWRFWDCASLRIVDLLKAYRFAPLLSPGRVSDVNSFWTKFFNKFRRSRKSAMR
jgi:hypothetical protein